MCNGSIRFESCICLFSKYFIFQFDHKVKRAFKVAYDNYGNVEEKT